MKRHEIDHLSLDDLFDIIIKTHGKTKANNFVSREFSRIVSKSLNKEKYLEIKKEACKRIISGQDDRVIININKEDLK